MTGVSKSRVAISLAPGVGGLLGRASQSTLPRSLPEEGEGVQAGDIGSTSDRAHGYWFQWAPFIFFPGGVRCPGRIPRC